MAMQREIGPSARHHRSLGRFVYGFAAIAVGMCTLAWQQVDIWQPISGLSDAPYHPVFACVIGSIEILAGAAVQWPPSARWGAAALGVIAFILTLLGLPLVIEHPLVYNGYGNVFDQLSLVAAALALIGATGRCAPDQTNRVAHLGYVLFCFCVVSFALEQLFYLPETARLVPQWMPIGQMFWAITTTIAFFLAALAMSTGIMARLASQLTTAMLASFGVFVWLPAIVANSRSVTNWTEGVQTLAIAASAWIITDYLSERRSRNRFL